jgi:hypothetical protein
MTQHAMLNNVDHRDLRVITAHGAAYGDDAMAVMTFPAEFREIQAHYPIVFAKSAEGEYTPLALLGFKEKQNLFLDGARWDAPYVPLMVTRLPFLIGAGANNQRMVHIDLDHPRVSRTDGELLFKEHGGISDHLAKMNSVLATIDQGMVATKPFVASLVELGLLESFVLDIQLPDGSEHRFAGFHTVQEDKLRTLTAEQLGKLHERGYLQAIFMVVASLAHFRSLIDRIGKRDAAAR